MKILLATAKVDEIRWATTSGLVDGVLTSPPLLRQENRSERELLAEICRAADGPVYATVHAVDGDETYRDGREMARISDQIVVQLPLVEDTIGAVRRLTNDGIRVAALLVFNAAQALLAAKAGAYIISPFVGRLDDIGQTGTDLIKSIVTIYKNYGYKTQILAASMRSPTHVIDCAMAGAHIATMPLKVLDMLFSHPLTDKGLDQFLKDYAKVFQEAPAAR